MNVTPNQIYQHYRGNRYIVEDTATDPETDRTVVIYRALYGECKLYVQTIERFTELVVMPKYNYSGPRMKLVTVDELHAS